MMIVILLMPEVSNINAQYGLCPSYPAVLAVPRALSPQELKAVAGFRSLYIYIYIYIAC